MAEQGVWAKTIVRLWVFRIYCLRIIKYFPFLIWIEYVISKTKVGDCPTSDNDRAFIISKGISHDAFPKDVEDGRWE